MRIAFDHQIFCNQRFGGISRYFTRLTKQLSESEHDVRIFAPLHQNHYVKDLSSGIVQGFGLKRYPPRGERLLLPISRFIARHVARRAIKKWQPNIVHETFYSPYRSGPETSCTVITVYDMIHELFKESFAPGDPTTHIKRIAVNRADHVICISESTRRDLIRLFSIPEENVSCVHLGFEQFPPLKKRNIAKPKTGRPFLLYVGGRAAYKNFTGFLNSIAASPKLMRDFDIIAFGAGRFLADQKALIKQLGFRDSQVQHITGDDDLLSFYYQQARAFVCPSLYEGFGLPLLEAAAHNCPVISSNTSSMPEVIGEAAEYFDPNDIEDMTRAIESVVYSDERIKQLKILGQERLKSFSWRQCAEETLGIYKRII
ncbi:MAG: glycosyltransferase family 1 protein [Proteobacteria bacterium]|nr:glycosyltransferase family 1 protein [Pseudomonadota bacterium]